MTSFFVCGGPRGRYEDPESFYDCCTVVKKRRQQMTSGRPRTGLMHWTCFFSSLLCQLSTAIEISSLLTSLVDSQRVSNINQWA